MNVIRKLMDGLRPAIPKGHEDDTAGRLVKSWNEARERGQGAGELLTASVHGCNASLPCRAGYSSPGGTTGLTHGLGFGCDLGDLA